MSAIMLISGIGIVAALGGTAIAYFVGHMKGAANERAKGLEKSVKEAYAQQQFKAKLNRDTTADDARKWMHDNASN